MTDAPLSPDDPLSPDEELVLAYLDGEASPEDVARLDVDPALQALAERMSDARDAVAAPVSPASPLARERAIRTAIAAFGDDEVADTGTRNRVSPMGARRWLTPAAGVAAAAVIVVGVVAGLGRLGSPSATNATSTAANDRSPSSGLSGATAAAPGQVPRQPQDETRSSASGVADLGDLTSPEQLRVAAAGRYTTDLASAAQGSSGTADVAAAPEKSAADAASSCEQSLVRANPDLGARLLVATARYQGSPAIVMAFTVAPSPSSSSSSSSTPSSPPTTKTFALAATDCSVLATVTN